MANVQHIVTGAGAPASAPPAVGAHYIDTTNKRTYVSTGTAAASDWGQPLQTGALPIVTGTAAPNSAPPAIGAHYVNTTAKRTYIAVGTASSADWVPLVTGAAAVVVTGNGAPDSPPPSIGALYVDAVTKNVRVATGTASEDDWGDPVFRGSPEGGGGGDANGIVYATEYHLDPDSDGVTFSIPSDQRIVEIEMPNADDTGSNQGTLKLAPIPVSEADHELLVIVRRTREENAAELVLPAMNETGGNDVNYTVIPQTLGGTAGTLFDFEWTIPIPIGFSAFRVYRRFGRAYFIATLAQ